MQNTQGQGERQVRKLRKLKRRREEKEATNHKSPPAAPLAPPEVAAAPPPAKRARDFTQMPGARGAKHAFLRERLAHVAKVLGGQTGEAEYKCTLQRLLPHLASTDPHVLVTSSRTDVQSFIDHTLLKADSQRAAIVKLCSEARQHQFAAVCVNSSRVAECSLLLQGTGVGIASVVGFPLGAMDSGIKALETRAAMQAGATEIDMVLPIGKLRDGHYQDVLDDIRGVARECGGKVKVIFETCLLTEEQIADACFLSALAGAEFVKTSTGFSTSGATPDVVDLMKAAVGECCKVKAAGGVRDRETALAYIRAGVSRIGTSSGIALLSEAPVATQGY